MKANRVVLTGATGFIGSYIAEVLVAQGYEILALRRSTSNGWRVASVTGQLTWANIDEPEWEQQVLAWQANYLVHSAWLGVGVGQRDDWQSQLSNLTFTMQLLQLLTQGPLHKVVVLGSQAEYGAFEGRIDETYPANPTSAYGAVKLATLDLLRAYCQAKNLEWYWLRVFAVFGPREDAHWFVSFVTTSMLQQKAPVLTDCEQQYDYLFVPDLAQAIVQTLPAPMGHSGIYNIGANKAICLRNIVDGVREITKAACAVHYGVLPYRSGQVMHMESNSDKFEQIFGPLIQTPLPVALQASVDYVRKINFVY